MATLLAIPLAVGISQGQQGGMPSYPQKDLSGMQQQQSPSLNRNNTGSLDDTNPPTLDQKRLAALNELRQKELAADTEKLLALATELKAQMDKAGKDTLSLDVIRKAEQIEKLAKSVKQKMKASIGS